MKMYLRLHIHFETDGDYCVNEWDNIFDKECSLYSGEPLNYHASIDSESYDFTLDYEGKEAQQCRWAARDILRNLIVNIRVSPSHYYLVKDLYELLYKAYDELMSCRNVYCNKCLSGNYEGTEVTLRVIYQEGDNDPARKSRLNR